MPLTDLRNITLPLALRYTSRFGLNRSQGTYFYQIVRKSPPDTYLADLKHLSQPSSTSLLGRLLREACGTLPQLIPPELVHDNTQSRRAWYNFEMKYGPSQMAEPPQEASAPPTTALSDQKVTDEPFESPASVSAGVITLLRHPTTPPPATQQLPLSIPIPVETPPRSADTCQYPHTYGITNTQSQFPSPINDSNLHPQYLHFYSSETSTHSEPIQQDDMDCLPPSPFLSSDVDMDILTDTEPAPPSYDHIPWTQWIPAPEYVPVPPLHDNMFVAQPVSIWQTPIQDPPLSASQYSSGFAAPTQLYVPSFHADTHTYWDAAINDLPGHTIASAAPDLPMDHHNLNFLPTYHPGSLDPINVASDRTQDTVEIHWQEPPHHAGPPDRTSVATLLDEFERSLTLAADDTPPSEADNRSDHNYYLEPTPACVIKDERRISFEPIATPPPQTNASDVPLAILDSMHSIDHPDDSAPGLNPVSDAGENNQDNASLFESEATEEGACFLNIRDSPPPPFERESTEPLEDDQDQPPVDPLPAWFDREATEPLEQGEDWPPGCMLDQPRRPLDPVSLPPDTVFEASVTRPRQPTPPPSRRTKASHDTNTNKRTTRQSIARLVATARAVLDAKRLASNSNSNQDRIDLAQASVQARKRAQLQASLSGAKVLRPILARCGMGRREEGEGEEEGEKIRPAHNRRERMKRTRFLVPDAEEDAEEDLVASTSARPRRTRGVNRPRDAATSALAGPSSSRRTTATGPPRSILRNARATAMPYQKAAVRRAGRRASVP